jgi:hypothetical protein
MEFSEGCQVLRYLYLLTEWFHSCSCGDGLEYLQRSPARRKGLQQGHLVSEGCKYGNLALQVGRVSYETGRWGHESCETWTRERQGVVPVNFRPVLSSPIAKQ